MSSLHSLLSSIVILVVGFTLEFGKSGLTGSGIYLSVFIFFPDIFMGILGKKSEILY